MRAPSQRFTDRFGTTYTLLTLSVVLIMFLVWWLGLGIPLFESTAETKSAFYRAMTLLVVMSPCALVLSIPSAILAAIAWGARRGILFRGGAAIEKLAEVDLVAMDKTGTLTEGNLRVALVESFPPGREKEVLSLAVTLDAHSNHPIALAITRHAKDQGIEAGELIEFQSLPGLGLRGRTTDGVTYVGRRELMDQGDFAQWLKDVPDAPLGFSEVWVLNAGTMGRVLLKDEIRSGSKAVLAQLAAEKVITVMLTGDRRAAASQVAHELGVTDVRAGLHPEDKVAAIKEFTQQGRKVAMIGDGVNDAPSLAAAYVSVAMGARGSDAALEQADVVLMQDKIEKLLSARHISQAARRIIRQNLAISLGSVIVMAIASLFGIVPLTLGVLTHEGSTVIVCLNSLRLLFVKEASMIAKPTD
jgi:Cd2+/Zn2+-exporting ATPase